MPLPPALSRFLDGILFKSSWAKLDLEEAVRRFRTPRAIHRFMSVSFKFVHDEAAHGVRDHWKMPHDMLIDRFGDCEDYSVFAWYVLKQHGYDAQLFTAFTTEGQGHCVCLFREGDWMHALCNEGLRMRIVRTGDSADESERVARAAAARIFPRKWRTCSYVTHLHKADGPEGHAQRYLPVYEWIERRRT